MRIRLRYIVPLLAAFILWMAWRSFEQGLPWFGGLYLFCVAVLMISYVRRWRKETVKARNSTSS